MIKFIWVIIMQINRLFEIVYILFNKKTITAKELSEHFEVSQRTIYRDIETLCMAGIPIYTSKGKGGGISILPEFVLNKSVLSDKEQNEILSALQSLNALNVPNVNPTLNKLASLFNKNNASWIDVDFSHWSSDEKDKEKFKLLRDAIFESKVIKFDYYSSYGEKSSRTVEPLKLVFKGQSWYVYSYCRTKNDYRMFKITRINDLIVNEESFNRTAPQNIFSDINKQVENKMLRLQLKFDEKLAYRVLDEFSWDDIEKNNDGSFNVNTSVPEGDWIYDCIMSYGEHVEVIEPQYIKDTLISKYEKVLKKYL